MKKKPQTVYVPLTMCSDCGGMRCAVLGESVYLRFTNCKGEKTRLKLSPDGAKALTQLLVHRSDDDEPTWKEVKP